MSYCRGDVYCYGAYDFEKPSWCVHIGHDVKHYYAGSVFKTHSLDGLLLFLESINASGIPVPVEAFVRIHDEIIERDNVV